MKLTYRGIQLLNEIKKKKADRKIANERNRYFIERDIRILNQRLEQEEIHV